MLNKYVIGFNWVDFLIIAIICRMAFIGIRTGTLIEIFKSVFLWLATVIAMQIYTTPVSDLLQMRVPALPLDASDVFVFCVLITLIILLGRIIRESFFLLIKVESKNTWDRWGGLAIGLMRSLLVSSMALFIMTISTIVYLEKSAKTSIMGSKLLLLAPIVYSGTYRGLVEQIMPSISLNEEVFKAVDR